MRNRLTNCGFLDGTNNWSAIGAATLSVDETTYGAPGRAVLKAAGTASGEQGVVSQADLITAGLDYDCHARWYGTAGSPVAKVEWLDNSDAVVATSPLPQDQPATYSPAQWGVPSTFNRSYQRVTAPVGATKVRMKLTATFGGSTAYELVLLKPYVGRTTGIENKLHWDPGPHDLNDDLNAIAAWPHDLPPVQWEGYQSPPTSVRKAFEADSAIPGANKTGAVQRAEMKGVIRCNPVQVEILRRFHDQTPTPFYFVRPDTDELCFAEWLADGAPAMQQLAPGGGGYWGVGLLLATA